MQSVDKIWKLNFTMLKLCGEPTTVKAGFCIILFSDFIGAVNSSIRSYKIFHCTEIQMRNASEKNVSVVKQQCCTALLYGAEAV